MADFTTWNSPHYDTHRPSYPPTLLTHLLEQMALAGPSRHGARVLELGAGTGKLTEQLAAREEGYRVVAVEPGAAMRATLSAKGLKGVEVREGSAGDLGGVGGEGDEVVDGVVCGQAFHYFASLDVLHRIHAALAPATASLGLIWNVDSYNAPKHETPPTSYEKAMHEHLWTLDDGQPRYRHEQWRKVFDEQVGHAGPLKLLISGGEQMFSLPLGEEREAWEVRLTREQIWERYSSLSQVDALKGEEREKAYNLVMDALNAPDVKVDEQGRVALHGESIAVWTSKIPGEGKASVTHVERPGA